MLLGEGFEVGIEEAGTAGLGLGCYPTLVLLGLHATGEAINVVLGLDGFTGLVHWHPPALVPTHSWGRSH